MISEKIDIMFGQFLIDNLRKLDSNHNSRYIKNLSANRNIKLENIEQNTDYLWNFKYLSSNPNINIDFINKYKDNDWNWYELSSNPKISIEDVINNKKLCWNSWVFNNPNFKLDYISWNNYILENFNVKIIDYQDLVRYVDEFTIQNICSFLTLEEIEINKNNFFDIIGISKNKNLTIDFILKYPDWDWKYEYICLLPFITEEILDKYSHLDWNWSVLSFHRNISLEYIENNIDKSWSWCNISCNPNLTISFIKKNFSKRWCWYLISKNEAFTCDIIQQNDLLPWDWYYVCKNPNITFEFLEKIIKKGYRVSWFNLCDNKFTYQKKLFREQKIKEYYAVRKIEDFYLQAKYSPYNKLGKKFISKLYDNNFS